MSWQNTQELWKTSPSGRICACMAVRTGDKGVRTRDNEIGTGDEGVRTGTRE